MKAYCFEALCYINIDVGNSFLYRHNSEINNDNDIFKDYTSRKM